MQVIQYARQLPCYLNRQFITLLGTLGVPDKVIEERYSAMVSTLDKVLRTVKWRPSKRSTLTPTFEVFSQRSIVERLVVLR